MIKQTVLYDYPPNGDRISTKASMLFDPDADNCCALVLNENENEAISFDFQSKEEVEQFAIWLLQEANCV